MKKIFIIAGETSGDQHAAKLVHQLNQRDSDISFSGIGGNSLHKEGVEILIDNSEMAVIGAIEVLAHFGTIFNAWKKTRKFINEEKPDLIILVDYPGFNLRIAKFAKKKGVKVVYYISPQVWAWKQRRVKTIRKFVDLMLVIFPFEETFYQKHNVPVAYVGHPLAEHVKTTLSVKDARLRFNIPEDKTVIGLLPGSRKGEVERLMPTLIQTADRLMKANSNLIFVIPLAPSLHYSDLEKYLNNTSLPIYIINDHFYDVMQMCAAAIVTSGTATLETALLGIPMAIIYKTAASTYYIAKKIIKIPYIGLCNIVAGQQIVKEFIQHKANPNNISEEILKVLNDKDYRKEMINHLAEIKSKLKKPNVAAADSILKILNSH